MTETKPAGTTLTIAANQKTWSGEQRKALEHIGVDQATDEDLAVFFHVVKRTGLDPFARQIHMIPRVAKQFDRATNQWVKKTTHTIQTGIDGYRLIARRAADRAAEQMEISAPEWAHEDGSWRPVWSSAWGHPLGARVTVTRGGAKFTGVALFEEYRQTKRDGTLTSMWAQRPAGQIAKCAEALALRMAYPQDMAHIYVEDEMHQATNPPRPEQAASEPMTREDFAPAAPAGGEDIVDAEVVTEDRASKEQRTLLVDVLTQAGLGKREDALGAMSSVLRRDVAGTADLTAAEAEQIIDAIRTDLLHTGQEPAETEEGGTEDA